MRNHCIIGIAAIVLVTLSNNGGCHDIDDQVFRQTASDPAVWLDEGVMAKGEFHDWEEQKTFCFHNNATLRIRLDPLDSTLQPLLIRKFGQSKHAKTIHAFIGTFLHTIQKKLWPLKTLLWSWNQLRVVVQSIEVESIHISYKRKPGSVCSYLLQLQRIVGSTPMLPSIIQNALDLTIYTAKIGLCENCVNDCPLTEGYRFNDTQILILSPYHSPCITIRTYKKPLLATSPPTISYVFSFYTVLSTLYIQNFICGIILYYASTKLARSRTFHYILGASIGICFSAGLALYLLSRQTRSFTKMIPGITLLQSVSSIFSIALPFTSFVIIPSTYRFLTWILRSFVYLWEIESLFGIPHFGKLYFAVFGLIGCVFVWWYQWGATPKEVDADPERCPQDPDEIEEIGKLDPVFPLTFSQLYLSRILRLLGIVFLLQSTSSTEVSLLVILLVSISRVFEFIGLIMYFWYHYEKPGKHSVLISTKEFEEQAVSETEKALKELQNYIRTHPDALDTVKEENEIRLRRFAKGRNHLDVAMRRPTRGKETRSNKRSCVMQ